MTISLTIEEARAVLVWKGSMDLEFKLSSDPENDDDRLANEIEKRITEASA